MTLVHNQPHLTQKNVSFTDSLLAGNLSTNPPVDLSNSPTSAHNGENPAHVHLLGASEIRQLAAQVGVLPTKRLGQNFVIDPNTVRTIARLSKVNTGSLVLEVGPGLGSLTLALLEQNAHVIAVEIDITLAQLLPKTIEKYAFSVRDNIVIHRKNALEYTMADFFSDYAQLAQKQSLLSQEKINEIPPCTLVANLPYNVATPILLTLLDEIPNLSHFVVMVQKEVAERLVAQPGSKIYGAPTVKLAWYGMTQRAGNIGKNVFWPAPNVDSALVSFSKYGYELHEPTARHDHSAKVDNYPNADNASAKKEPKSTNMSNEKNVSRETFTEQTISNLLTTHYSHDELIDNSKEIHHDISDKNLKKATFQLIDLAFNQRRKTLQKALKGNIDLRAFEMAHILPTSRGETLTIHDFIRLAEANEALKA